MSIALGQPAPGARTPWEGPARPSAPVSCTYDADGQRAGMVGGTGTTTYTYDNLGRLVVSTTEGAGDTVAYSYDPTGNVTAMACAGLTVGYNPANGMTSVSDGLGDITGYAYDGDANLVTETYPNHVVATNTYDPADQPKAIPDTESGSTVASFDFARNGDSLVTTETETRPAALVSSPAAETTAAAANNTYTP